MKKIRFNLFSLFLCITISSSLFLDFKKVESNERKVIKIGVLQLLNHEALDTIYKGIVDGLKNKGYKDNENIIIDLKNAQGDQSNLELMSSKLVNEENDILVGITTLSTLSLANNTKNKPIIMAGITYPVESGLINSEKSSGNNITGVSDRTPLDMQLNLITKIIPNIKTLGILYTAGEENSVRQAEQMEKLAKNKNINVLTKSLINSNDLNQNAEIIAKNVDAIFVPIDNNIASAMPTLISITDSFKIPVFPSSESMVKDGGVLTIGVDQYNIGLKTANVIVDVINGTKPTDIPIVFENKGIVYLNEKKCNQLGLKIPNDILKKAVLIENK